MPKCLIWFALLHHLYKGFLGLNVRWETPKNSLEAVKIWITTHLSLNDLPRTWPFTKPFHNWQQMLQAGSSRSRFHRVLSSSSCRLLAVSGCLRSFLLWFFFFLFFSIRFCSGAVSSSSFHLLCLFLSLFHSSPHYFATSLPLLLRCRKQFHSSFCRHPIDNLINAKNCLNFRISANIICCVRRIVYSLAPPLVPLLSLFCSLYPFCVISCVCGISLQSDYVFMCESCPLKREVLRPHLHALTVKSRN